MIILRITVMRSIRLKLLQYIIGKVLLLYKLKVALFEPVQITNMRPAIPPQGRKLHKYLIKVLRFGWTMRTLVIIKFVINRWNNGGFKVIRNSMSITQRFRKEAERENIESYNFWFNRITEIALAGIKYENLPPEIDARFIELILCFDGKALFYYDEELEEFVVLQFYSSSTFDIYREPFKRVAFSPAVNYRNKNLSNENSVIIWNNSTRSNEILALRSYAKRISECERIIDVNVKGQKTPKIILTEDSQRLTMENLFRQYDGNIPFIFGTKGLSTLSEINVLDVTTPYIADKLQILKRQIISEALTYFGIDNANTEKKERLVSDEVTANFGGVEIARLTRLKAREEAVAKINKMFNLNIKVKFAEIDRKNEEVIKNE
nr:MAG TPA: upper collar protein [Caudoviricetes sp.]